jgi:DNA-binding NarL/FixJ family response regulator
MINTIVIDPEQKDRERINNSLSFHQDFNVQGLGQDGYDAIKLVTAFKPDIALLGVNLDIINGLDVLPLLKRQSPSTLVVILASKLDDNQISKALSNNIAGFLLKDSDLDELPFILKNIRFGECYINHRVSARIVHIFSEMAGKGREEKILTRWGQPIPPGLSKKELRIMSYIGEGRSNKEIAEYLRLTAGTVRNYVSSAMQKMDLKDRTQMAIYALINGLVNSDNL